MRHLSWQCYAIILILCLLIEVNSKSSKVKQHKNKVKDHELGNVQNDKNKIHHSKGKSGNPPARPKWNHKKAPHNCSAISREKIPHPNDKDRSMFEREVLEDHSINTRDHMTPAVANQVINPKWLQLRQHVKPDYHKSKNRPIPDKNITEIPDKNSKSRQLCKEGDISCGDITIKGLPETLKILIPGDEQKRSENEKVAHNVDGETRKRNLKEDNEDEMAEPPAPVRRSVKSALPIKLPARVNVKTREEKEAEEEYIFEKWFLNNDPSRENRNIHERISRIKTKYPKIFGLDLNNLGKDHPHQFMRNGSASFNDSCDSVKVIEDWMRKDETMYVGINTFYVKYTETYGIFIVGSSNVTDEGLMRACYTLKVMLASRYDIRNAYYKFFGRIALIGDGEQQTSLFEYSQWDAKYWNNRARGLGPTITIPLTSAGDDNQRCKSGDRYFNQDIFVHEMGHAVHLLGASFVVPGFQNRLKGIFQKNVKENGKWKGTYAANNLNEYFSVATQFYMNAFRGSSYMKFGVTDYDSLAKYDPDVFKLLQELYPCVGRHNKLIHRCSWKHCSLKSFSRIYEGSKFRTSSRCPVIKHNGKKYTVDQCAQYTCYYQGNTFQYQAPNCYVLNCPGPATVKGLMIDQGKHTYDIYVAVDIPKMNLKLERAQHVTQLCVKGPLMKDKCKEVSTKDRISCGDLNFRACEHVGCCFDKSDKMCYFPKQDCVDRFLDCYQHAELGDCKRNPVMMYQKCPFACDVCKGLQKLKSDDWKSTCQDKSLYCADWASNGECTRNPGYMLKNCELSCTKCKVVDPLA